MIHEYLQIFELLYRFIFRASFYIYVVFEFMNLTKINNRQAIFLVVFVIFGQQKKYVFIIIISIKKKFNKKRFFLIYMEQTKIFIILFLLVQFKF